MRAARSVCAMTSLAVWTAALLTSTNASRAAYVSRAVCTAPPAPDGKKKAVPEGHAKPSSYAPQPRSPNRAYGAPIQRPILSKHKRPKHRTDHSTSTKKSAPGGAD
ncbi:MAG: hypothetical protein E6K32_05030 [Gammaproteobacteria bacterium]|nr:MAG: hypothetical protein E6K32_05030 [Gammaproteobacteria bacterium]